MDTDKNWKSYGPEYNGQTLTPDKWENPPEGTELGYDDILKITGKAEDFGADGLTIAPGKENNVDMVRGKRLFLRNCTLAPGAGQGAIVIKGAIDTWEVSNSIVPNGPKFGIQVGQFDNYWYPFRAPTRRGLIRSVSTWQGQPVVVELWDAETPKVEHSTIIFKRVPKWKWFPYFLFMYVKVRLSGAKTK